MKKIITVLISILMIFGVSTFAFAAEKQTDNPYENSQYFTEGDYRLHYRIFETEVETKNQIILLHGFGLSGASLESLAEEYVEAGYRVVLADLPNFGYSSRETNETKLIDREELIFDLMKSINNSSWIVGGHSMGGGIAINIACDHSDYVSGLILFAPQTSSQQSSFASALCKTNFVEGIFNSIISLAGRYQEIVRPLVAYSFSDNDYAKDYDVNKISVPLKTSGTGAGYAIMLSHARTTQTDKLSALSIPVAILTCSNDKVANSKSLKEIINNAPENTYFYEFSAGGHMFMEYNPKGVAEETLSVIGSCNYILNVK